MPLARGHGARSPFRVCWRNFCHDQQCLSAARSAIPVSKLRERGHLHDTIRAPLVLAVDELNGQGEQG